MQHNIILIGPMGAGKTTVGRIIAEYSQRAFVDTDHEVERRSGASISWIFDKEGESGFRTRETNALTISLQAHNAVIATGGGIVTQAINREMLIVEPCVVYLYAPLEVQYSRTMRDKSRPLLQHTNPQQKLSELFLVRDPLYRSVANLVLPTNEHHAKDLAIKIIEHFDR